MFVSLLRESSTYNFFLYDWMDWKNLSSQGQCYSHTPPLCVKCYYSFVTSKLLLSLLWTQSWQYLHSKKFPPKKTRLLKFVSTKGVLLLFDGGLLAIGNLFCLAGILYIPCDVSFVYVLIWFKLLLSLSSSTKSLKWCQLLF